MAERIARTVTVHGLVQGVFFRDSCRREAAALGVAGWIRNDPAGTVTAYVEGEPDAVGALVDWLRVGPPRADVEHVEVDAAPVEGGRGFEVTG